jgi:hypothetical protein
MFVVSEAELVKNQDFSETMFFFVYIPRQLAPLFFEPWKWR